MFAGLLVDKGLHGNILYEAPIVRVGKLISLNVGFSLSKNIDFTEKKKSFISHFIPGTEYFFIIQVAELHSTGSNPESPILILMNL